MGGAQSQDTGDRILPSKLGRVPRFRYFPLRRFEDDFHPPDVALGNGINGKVCLAQTKLSEQSYVTKVMNKKKAFDRVGYVLGEVNCHLAVDHPYITELFAIYEDSKTITFVLENCPGVDIQQHMESHGGFSEKVVAQIAYQMLLSVRYVHARGIAHRDIKLENWILHFVDDQKTMPRVKLIDFGFACRWEEGDEPMDQHCGSLSYMSPEVLEGQYTNKSDVWAIGICLYRMICGIPPFFGTENQIIKRILARNISFSGGRWKSISSSGRLFIQSLLDGDPEARPTAEEALYDAWLIEDISSVPSVVTSHKKDKNSVQKTSIVPHHLRGHSMKKSPTQMRRRKSSPGFMAALHLTLLDELDDEENKKAPEPFILDRATTSVAFNRGASGLPLQRGISAMLVSTTSRSEILEAFKEFEASSAARQLFLFAVASASRVSSDTPEIQKLFLWMDRDNKGTISYYDFDEVLRSQFAVSSKETRSLFDVIAGVGAEDEDESKEITFTAFAASLLTMRLTMLRKAILVAFQKISAFSDPEYPGLVDMKAVSHVFNLDSEKLNGQPCALDRVMAGMCSKPTKKKGAHFHDTETLRLGLRDFASVVIYGTCQ